LGDKLAVSQNNPICGAEEQKPELRKQHRLSQSRIVTISIFGIKYTSCEKGIAQRKNLENYALNCNRRLSLSLHLRSMNVP